MVDFIRYTKSDLYKLKYSSFYFIHLALPICGVGLLLLYTAFSSISELNVVSSFFQIFAICYPFIIAIVCNIVEEQEMGAGYSQNLLTLPHRGFAVLSKFLILITFGFLAMIGSAALFYILLPIFRDTASLSIEIFLFPALVLWSANIMFYAVYFMISFRFGKNTCIGLGAVGSLLAALLQTGLGTGIWFVIPYGIGIHLSDYALNYALRIEAIQNAEITTAIVICIVLTVLLVIILMIWFRKYSGKHTVE